MRTTEEYQMIWEYNRATVLFMDQRTDVLMRLFPFLRRLPTVYEERYDAVVIAKNALTDVFYRDAKVRVYESIISIHV